MAMLDAILAGGWLHREPRGVCHLSLPQFGCVSIPHELGQLGDS